MHRTASMSIDGVYRWQLARRWAPSDPDGARTMAWIMLNPSTANHEQDDPTIRRCIRFAQAWGFTGLVVYNLFAVRMTDPAQLLRHADPVGAQNAQQLRQAASRELVVAAWGAHPAATRVLGQDPSLPHSTEVVEAIQALPGLRCLGVTKDGHPRHPLYVRGDAPLQPWPQVVRHAQ